MHLLVLQHVAHTHIKQTTTPQHSRTERIDDVGVAICCMIRIFCTVNFSQHAGAIG